jgi:hypothetical protein
LAASDALDLRHVTLCAADCVNPALALGAMRRSMQSCDFGAAILFSDLPPDADGSIRRIRIPRLNSRDDYSRFILKDLVNFVETPFVLIVQWDGYVLEPRAWQERFTRYDLIGAKWYWHGDGMTVGNGGFTLRSRKLLETTASATFAFIDGVNEDEQICRLYRSRLEAAHGIRFAPEEVADAFSYERWLPDLPTFGFHGLFNMWRHVDDAEMMEIAAQFSPSVFLSTEFLELLAQYQLMRKFAPLRRLYSLSRRHVRAEDVRARLSALTGHNDTYVAQFIAVCERLDAPGPGAVHETATQR